MLLGNRGYIHAHLAGYYYISNFFGQVLSLKMILTEKRYKFQYYCYVTPA